MATRETGAMTVVLVSVGLVIWFNAKRGKMLGATKPPTAGEKVPVIDNSNLPDNTICEVPWTTPYYLRENYPETRNTVNPVSPSYVDCDLRGYYQSQEIPPSL